jgi:predicted nucleic acid-binding protein
VIRTCFADTWFFVAQLDRADGHHLAVRRIDAWLQRTGTRLLTHDAVFSEVLAHLSDEGARARSAASRAVRRAIELHDVLPADRPLVLRALDLYERRPDKQYSLVDCMSMTLMRERGITHVLTHDHHFAQEGFTVVSDAP